MCSYEDHIRAVRLDLKWVSASARPSGNWATRPRILLKPGIANTHSHDLRAGYVRSRPRYGAEQKTGVGCGW
jgi:hypothetical protein